MKRQILIILILGIPTMHLYSQCKLTTKNGNYDAICFEKLYRTNTTIGGGAEIAIAKDGKKGFFIIKLPYSDTNFKGKAYIYLDDNSIITLIYKGTQWKVNDQLFGQFNLTETEITKLQESNINAVRYWTCPIKGIEDCGEASEYYNKSFTDDILKNKIERVDFPNLVKGLYQNSD